MKQIFSEIGIISAAQYIFMNSALNTVYFSIQRVWEQKFSLLPNSMTQVSSILEYMIHSFIPLLLAQWNRAHIVIYANEASRIIHSAGASHKLGNSPWALKSLVRPRAWGRAPSTDTTHIVYCTLIHTLLYVQYIRGAFEK